MRLLRTDLASGLCISEFDSEQAPPYAILSHTWEDEEILFSDARGSSHTHKAGYSKLVGACSQAQKDAYDYIWIDTCCIDKSSSAELSEAINSMWTYYREAGRCYAYLSDVAISEESASGEEPSQHASAGFLQARWFTRGWTLQELLAPKQVVFFDCNWRRMGTKIELAPEIERITGINIAYLRQLAPIQSASTAKRMSWASGRQTTRKEDVAYSLMGLFAVNMPMLYGEGAKAFIRLQIEIMVQSDDQSLFAWKTDTESLDETDDFHGLLADHPKVFAQSGEIVPYSDRSTQKPYSMTNRGLNIEFDFLPDHIQRSDRNEWTVPLRCFIPGRVDSRGSVSIRVRKIFRTGDQFVRVSHHTLGFREGHGTPRSVYIKQHHSPSIQDDYENIEAYHYFILGGQPMSLQYHFSRLHVTECPCALELDCEFKKMEGPEIYGAQWKIQLFPSFSRPRAFRIGTEARSMAVALILRETPSKLKPPLSIAILLGCITEHEKGFDICEWPIPTERRRKRYPYQDLQVIFNPKAMGSVLTWGLWKLTVTTEERTESEEGRNLHLVNILIGRDDEVRNANDSAARSLASKIL